MQKLPVIFFCENNGYAISVPLSVQTATESIASRAQGYGIPGLQIDGCDVFASHEAVSEAATRARDGDGPTLIEAMVERYLPHTSDDDDSRYRPREEIEEARKRDPLKTFRAQLIEQGVLTDDAGTEIQEAALREVNEATDFVEAAPYPGTDDFDKYVYAGSGGGPSP